jgi:hypothetical protein
MLSPYLGNGLIHLLHRNMTLLQNRRKLLFAAATVQQSSSKFMRTRLKTLSGLGIMHIEEVDVSYVDGPT